jgi:hypothetical protein
MAGVVPGAKSRFRGALPKLMKAQEKSYIAVVQNVWIRLWKGEVERKLYI